MDLPLGDQSRRVLYGLCRYPQLRDKAVAGKLGMARSTYGAIKGQLMDSGVVQAAYLPDFGALGCELMACSYIEDHQEGSVAPLLRPATGDTEGLPQMVHLIAEGSKAVGLAYYRNYTEYDRLAAGLCQGLLRPNQPSVFQDVLFPLAHTMKLALFDFAGVVNRLLELGYDDPYPKVLPAAPTQRTNLRPSQQAVLLALLELPTATDRELTAATGLSLPTVAKARRDLLGQGLLRPRWLPRSLKDLGVEILAMVHAHLDPTANIIQRIQTLQRLLTVLTPFLFVAKASDLYLLAPFRHFSEYQHHHSQLLGQLWTQGLLLAPPTTLLIEVGRVEPLKHFAFAPLVRHLLGI